MEHDGLFVWDLDTIVLSPPSMSSCVAHALRFLARDVEKVLSHGAEGRRTRIEIAYAEEGDSLFGTEERFTITFPGSGEPDRGTADCGGVACLKLTGSDDLGIVYGLLHLSRTVLGVDPFWFWMDAEPARKGKAVMPVVPFESKPFFVRYRGWFVNDEDFILGWTETYPPPQEAWLPVFETLLRLGGNMVIPGTDLPRGSCGERLASELGLYVTHHHAEPLGAEMFKRAHPDLEARYDRHPDLFEALWADAVCRGASRKTVWGLGFRGQGDCPFWEQNPAYDTPEKRGELISSIIAHQKELLTSAAGAAPCCSYVYGELTELYRDGNLTLPERVIRIWADNGYGRMVSRRRGNENPRTPSLPETGDPGPHGVYYHVAFHDLQASNHLTMFPNEADLIRGELTAAFQRGATAYLLVNSANVRHHEYPLDIVAELWREGDVDVEDHRRRFAERFFPSGAEAASHAIAAYSAAALRYGIHDDDRAGDEFYHHPPRSLLACWMRGETDVVDEDLRWATDSVPLGEQFAVCRGLLERALPGLVDLEQEAEAAAQVMVDEDARRFRSFFCFQAAQLRLGCAGFLDLCRAYDHFVTADYPRAFVSATAALREYRTAARLLAEAQTGHWANFYRFDYLTNIGATVYAVETLRSWLRQFGDAPDYFRWSRSLTVDPRERGIYLENTTRRVLRDDELAEALAAALGESPLP